MLNILAADPNWNSSPHASSTDSALSQHHSHRKGLFLSSFIKNFFTELYFRLFIFIKVLCAYVCVLCILSFSARRNSHFEKSLLYSRRSPVSKAHLEKTAECSPGALTLGESRENHIHKHVLLTCAVALGPVTVLLCRLRHHEQTARSSDTTGKKTKPSTAMLITSSPSATRQM